MAEETEEQSTKQFDFRRYSDIIRRRHMFFLVPLLIGWALVWGASWVLPARYKSSTLILVEQPTMPKNYVIPNVNDDLQARLQSIKQQILSRTRLLLIIDHLHLYQENGAAPTSDQKAARMVHDINLELVRDDGSNTIHGFRVSYSAASPLVAQEVTSALTSLFINENQKTLQQQSENTTQFLQKQLAIASANLANQEAKVQQFQSAHQGELPTQQAGNLQILAGLQSQLQSESDALNTARQQRIYYESLIEQYRAIGSGSDVPGASPTGLASMDEQIAKMKADLANLLTRYTDQYPAVQQLKNQIADEEQARAHAAAVIASHAKDGAPAPSSAISTSAANGANPHLLQLQSQLHANQTEIVNRERAIAELQARIGTYQGRLNAEPASQQQLADLTRGYEQSQANYNDLLKKESDSSMATSMEQMQQGERFSVLDPPSLPLKPDFPNRLKFCGLGIAAGLALAVLIGGGLEFLDDRLHGDKDITKLLPIAVISEVPEIVSPTDRKRDLVKAGFGWTMAVLVFAIITAGSVFSYLHA